MSAALPRARATAGAVAPTNMSAALPRSAATPRDPLAPLVTVGPSATPCHEKLALHLNGSDPECRSLFVIRASLFQKLQHAGRGPFRQLVLKEVEKQPV